MVITGREWPMKPILELIFTDFNSENLGLLRVVQRNNVQSPLTILPVLITVVLSPPVAALSRKGNI